MIVIITPSDPVGKHAEMFDWCMRHSIPGPLVYELRIDTVRRQVEVFEYEGTIDITSNGPHTTLKADKATGDPIKRKPYTVPLKDNPPDMERVLRTGRLKIVGGN